MYRVSVSGNVSVLSVILTIQTSVKLRNNSGKSARVGGQRGVEYSAGREVSSRATAGNRATQKSPSARIEISALRRFVSRRRIYECAQIARAPRSRVNLSISGVNSAYPATRESSYLFLGSHSARMILLR